VHAPAARAAPAAGPVKRPPGAAARAAASAAAAAAAAAARGGYAAASAAAAAALSATLRPCAGVVYVIAPASSMLRALAAAASGAAGAPRGAAGVALHPLSEASLHFLAGGTPQRTLAATALGVYAKAYRRRGRDVLADLVASSAAAHAHAAAALPPPAGDAAAAPPRAPPLASPYLLAAAGDLPRRGDGSNGASAAANAAAAALTVPPQPRWALHCCYARCSDGNGDADAIVMAWCRGSGAALDGDVLVLAPRADATAVVGAVLSRLRALWADMEAGSGAGSGGVAVTRLGAVPPAEGTAWCAALSAGWPSGGPLPPSCRALTLCAIRGCIAAPRPHHAPPPPPPPGALLLLPPASATAFLLSRSATSATPWWLRPPAPGLLSHPQAALGAACAAGVDVCAISAVARFCADAETVPTTPDDDRGGGGDGDGSAAAAAAAAAAVAFERAREELPALAAALSALAALGAPAAAGAAAPPLPLHVGAAARGAGLLRMLRALADGDATEKDDAAAAALQRSAKRAREG
jgi:hypothetical protein